MNNSTEIKDALQALRTVLEWQLPTNWPILAIDYVETGADVPPLIVTRIHISELADTLGISTPINKLMLLEASAEFLEFVARFIVREVTSAVDYRTTHSDEDMEY